MSREVESMSHAFAQWAKQATVEELREFAEELAEEIECLEEDDFFGTEGINKRFA